MFLNPSQRRYLKLRNLIYYFLSVIRTAHTFASLGGLRKKIYQNIKKAKKSAKRTSVYFAVRIISDNLTLFKHNYPAVEIANKLVLVRNHNDGSAAAVNLGKQLDDFI